MELQRSTPPLKWIFNEKYWWAYHLTFWLFIYLDELLYIIGITNYEINPISFLPGFIADLLLVYFNIYYLLPNFLLKNKLWQYVGLTVITLVLNVIISAYDFAEPYDLGQPEEIESYFNIAIYMFMYTGTILAAAVGIKFFKSYVTNQEKITDMKMANLRTELAFLKNQINPHFLFNCLNNIYVQSRKRSEEASESILLLSDLLRYQLYDCAKEKVLLSNEIDYLKNYLELDRIRKKKPNISFVVQGEISGVMVAPFIFIPFVENAVKFGLTKVKNAYLNITFNVTPRRIHFYIENAKPEILRSDNEVGGIGLPNVKRRLELLYPNRHDLHIENQETLYSVNLNLTL